MRLLVTGGTGTFGRAMIRRALTPQDPGVFSAVISYARDEVKQAQMVSEFGHCPPFKPFLGDVRDSTRLSMALRGVDVVVHAAALKRVDVGAYSPSELIATNVIGTMNVVNAAIQAGVKRVVVISSDKAVHATNIYGSSKHMAECYAVSANNYGHASGTLICAVRYGNIIGSRGSVFHIWRDQLRDNRPLTITHAEMSRFMMTIEQAVDLVHFAIQNTQGGEVFVPILPSAKMTEFAKAVAIYERAREDYPTRVTELRPGGEKMAETLLNQEEVARTRLSRNRYVIAPANPEWTLSPFYWHGIPVPPTMEYTSDKPVGPWLNAAELVKMIESTEACR